LWVGVVKVGGVGETWGLDLRQHASPS